MAKNYALTWDPATVAPVPLGIAGSWNLVFRDEFNGAISESAYRSYYGTTTANNATLAQVFSASDMTSNPNYGNLAADTGETGGIMPIMSATSGGQLIIGGNNVSCSFEGRSYAQRRGLVRTTQDYLYGAFEARIACPQGQGLWPAFWLWPAAPDSQSDFPEIDIFEAPSTAATLIYSNVHRWQSGSSTFQSGPTSHSIDATQPHVYGCKWNAAGVTWYIDGVQTNSFTNTGQLAAVPLCVHMDFQIGGTWPGAVDGTTPWPSSVVVDYLRIWQ